MQIKAIASGNPQILEKVAVEVELTKLERLYSAWSASRQRLRRQMESLPSHLESVAGEILNHQRPSRREIKMNGTILRSFDSNLSSES